MPREHPAPLKRGEDSRENWRTINQINELLQPYISEIRRLSSAVADLRMRPNVKEGGGGGSAIRVKVLGYDDDVILCEGIGYVAKPFRLTKTPFHGQTIGFTDERGRVYSVTYAYQTSHRRTATTTTAGGNTIVESQVIVPRYQPNLDYVYVLSAPQVGVVAPDGSPVSYIDINADGRAWARER